MSEVCKIRNLIIKHTPSLYIRTKAVNVNIHDSEYIKGRLLYEDSKYYIQFKPLFVE
ncbi:hypothetical protein BDF14DRAFT_1791265 [Spinellus fusiger]|nr:hypothetical protein BDF14DRAFT_1791265 [Spinellus fusiger]